MKQCTSCKEIKPLSEFYNKKQGKNGKNSMCKLCCKAAVTKSHSMYNSLIDGALVDPSVEPDEIKRKIRTDNMLRIMEHYAKVPTRMFNEPCNVVDNYLDKRKNS